MCILDIVDRIAWPGFRKQTAPPTVWSQEAMVKYARRPITACMPAFSKKYEMRVLRRDPDRKQVQSTRFEYSMDILSSNRVDC